MLELLLEYTSSIKDEDFVLAAKSGSMELVELLLNHGANVDARGPHGEGGLNKTRRGTVVESLSNRGADLGKKDDFGCTALMYAASKGHLATVELLLNRGAQIEAKDYSGTTALIWAASWGHLATIE